MAHRARLGGTRARRLAIQSRIRFITTALALLSVVGPSSVQAQSCTGLPVPVGTWGRLAAHLLAADSVFTAALDAEFGGESVFGGVLAGVRVREEDEGTRSRFAGSVSMGLRSGVADAFELCPIVSTSLGIGSTAPVTVGAALHLGWAAVEGPAYSVVPGAIVNWSFERRDVDGPRAHEGRSVLRGGFGGFVGVTAGGVQVRQQAVRTFGGGSDDGWTATLTVALTRPIGG